MLHSNTCDKASMTLYMEQQGNKHGGMSDGSIKCILAEAIDGVAVPEEAGSRQVQAALPTLLGRRKGALVSRFGTRLGLDGVARAAPAARRFDMGT